MHIDHLLPWVWYTRMFFYTWKVPIIWHLFPEHIRWRTTTESNSLPHQLNPDLLGNSKAPSTFHRFFFLFFFYNLSDDSFLRVLFSWGAFSSRASFVNNVKRKGKKRNETQFSVPDPCVYNPSRPAVMVREPEQSKWCCRRNKAT